jgi:uncharacterized metal-binding protein YceD (DUF177 family)
MSAVEFNLDRLEPGRSTLEFDTVLVRENQVLQGHEVPGFTAAVRGCLDVDAMGHKVLIHGEFSATREMLCDRTAEPFDLEYAVEVEILVLRSPGRGRDECLGQEVGEDDNWVIHQPGGRVDLTEALLEAVALDEPQHVVHPDQDKIVSTSFSEAGASKRSDDEAEAIDPRWAALQELRDDDETDSGPIRK